MDRHTLEQTRNQVDELLRHGSPSCIRQANRIMAEAFGGILNFALELTEPEPRPKHTITDNFPAGGLTATEPCMYCEDYENLQAENKRLKEEGLKGNIPLVILDQIKKFRTALEKLAKLGNEPFFGNSEGNRIAQQALKD